MQPLPQPGKPYPALRPPTRPASSNLLLLLCILFIFWEHFWPQLPEPLTPPAPPAPPAAVARPHPVSAPAEEARAAREQPPPDPFAAARAARRARPLPSCAASGKRAGSFLLLFMGHSGSSAILSELRAHSQVYMEIGELVDHQETFNTTEALETTRAFFRRGRGKALTPGFKIRPMHILGDPSAWRALAAEFDTRILWQYRKNIFKATIGEYSYHVLNDTSVVEGFRQNVTKEERCRTGAGCSYRVEDFKFVHETLKKKLRSQNAITEAVHALTADSGCMREVPYEDYLYEREATMADVQRFLGFKAEKTLPGRFKATGDSMCDVVKNWDELCGKFYGCLAWQHMMDDARNKCFCSTAPGPTRYCDSTDPFKQGER